MSTGRILLLIAAFLALTLGSFIWYVATWETRKALQTSSAAPQLLLAPNIPAGGSALSTLTAGSKDLTT